MNTIYAIRWTGRNLQDMKNFEELLFRKDITLVEEGKDLYLSSGGYKTKINKTDYVVADFGGQPKVITKEAFKKRYKKIKRWQTLTTG